MKNRKAFKRVVNNYDVMVWGEDIFLLHRAHDDYTTKLKVCFKGEKIYFEVDGETKDNNEKAQQRISVAILNMTVTYRRLKRYLKKFNTFIVRVY